MLTEAVIYLTSAPMSLFKLPAKSGGGLASRECLVFPSYRSVSQSCVQPFSELVIWPIMYHCVCNKNIYPSWVQQLPREAWAATASSCRHLLLLRVKDLVAVFCLE